MEYEKVKGIVDAVQHVYQVCTNIFDGLRNPRADAAYIHADEMTVEDRSYEQASQEYASHLQMRKRRHYRLMTTEQKDAMMADDNAVDEEFQKVKIEYELWCERMGGSDRKGAYLRNNHLMREADIFQKNSKFKGCIRIVHDKFDSNLGTHDAKTVLEAIPACYERILREWKKDSQYFRDSLLFNVEQLNTAIKQVEDSIVTVIVGAVGELCESLQQEKGGNQHFQLCASKFYAAAVQTYTHKENRINYVPQYNPDMINILCDVQGAIVTWRAYGQDRTCPEPTKKIKIMQEIVRICFYSRPEIFNNEEDLDVDIRNRLNDAPDLVTLNAHVSSVTLKLAQLHQIANKHSTGTVPL
jgi:hypothetical protein